MQKSSGTLFVVASPIGNFGDFSFRAVETLKNADIIVAEDTRHTGNLMQKFEIEKKQLWSFHAQSSEKTKESILEHLEKGLNIALISDAGTPGISDPGTILVAEARLRNIPVSPIPGACAFVSALCAAGIPTDHFEFLGFFPHKKGRQTLLKNIAISEHTQIAYESTHRIVKLMEEMVEFFPEKLVVIAREITKMHEEFLRGKPSEILEIFKTSPEKTKGEFVVLVAGKKFSDKFFLI